MVALICIIIGFLQQKSYLWTFLFVGLWTRDLSVVTFGLKSSGTHASACHPLLNLTFWCAMVFFFSFNVLVCVCISLSSSLCFPFLFSSHL